MPRTIKRVAAQGRLLFHAPCFDGIVSAVLAHDFLSSYAGWSRIVLEGVSYARSRTWLGKQLHPNTAIVDFLYHPQAAFWADHHPTTFLDPTASKSFRSRSEDPWIIYDRQAPSCALLLQRHLERAFGYRNHRFDPLVSWATKIDSADYESPDEALSSVIPALRINLSLSLRGSSGYPERLVRWLLREDLQTVSEKPSVARRVARASKLFRVGLGRIAKAAEITPDGIVVFEVEGSSARVPRYGPYHFFPKARYSVGLVKEAHQAKLTAMRNPWRQFESVPLGGLLARYGGGGHHRVASVLLKGDEAGKASSVMRRVIKDLKRSERRIRALS